MSGATHDASDTSDTARGAGDTRRAPYWVIPRGVKPQTLHAFHSFESMRCGGGCGFQPVEREAERREIGVALGGHYRITRARFVAPPTALLTSYSKPHSPQKLAGSRDAAPQVGQHMRPSLLCRDRDRRAEAVS